MRDESYFRVVTDQILDSKFIDLYLNKFLKMMQVSETTVDIRHDLRWSDANDVFRYRRTVLDLGINEKLTHVMYVKPMICVGWRTVLDVEINTISTHVKVWKADSIFISFQTLSRRRH